ncbi:unnamed protein product [Mytilus edulis]|uniref:Ion transport domain-containing protein n=1 Tax=Mytilus edulis TaxID=6550 RepID=A0A8S3SGA3_MYTED|nr:unnamed protein product [Mytilus edulis]
MHRQNGCGDTVFHSLVKYSAVYPNKADNVIKMFTYLNQKIGKQNQNHEPHQDQDTDIFLKRDLFVWSLENQDCLTPLQLSAKLGTVEIFQFIINLKNVYSFDSSHDGLFDVKLYDITEIDTVANQHIASITNADESDGKNKKVSHNMVCFFTELIRRVIVGDLLRFAVIISSMLVAFTAGIYAPFVGEVGSEQNTSKYQEAVTEHFDSFGGAMLTMFKLMLGLDDFGVLNEARIPGLAITLYIVFALLTYVLLMNSLIAMMSQTCAVVLEDRYPQWRLQQLSVGLFIEDLFCLSCVRHTFGSTGIEKEICAFDPVTQEVKFYNRYFYRYIHYKQHMLQRKTEKH